MVDHPWNREDLFSPCPMQARALTRCLQELPTLSSNLIGNHSWRAVRTGSWTGPPRGKKAPRVGISSTGDVGMARHRVFGAPYLQALFQGVQGHLAHKKPPAPKEHHKALGTGML